MHQDLSKKSIRESIKSLALGDRQMEAELAVLYYKSICELKERYATGLIGKEVETLRFIRHQYRSTFHLLHLPALGSEVEKSRQILDSQHTSTLSIQASVASVNVLCDQVLAQLRLAYACVEEYDKQVRVEEGF